MKRKGDIGSVFYFTNERVFGLRVKRQCIDPGETPQEKYEDIPVWAFFGWRKDINEDDYEPVKVY